MFLKIIMKLSVCIAFILPFTLNAQEVDPFAVNNGVIPSKKVYDGTFFKFDYDYPKKYIKPAKMPWVEVLKGKPLTKQNAHEYILALKKHVSKSMRVFITDPQEWNRSAQTGWYSMLWAGEEIEKSDWEGREAIYGTYTGQIMDKDVYKKSGLSVHIRNHAAIYYDTTAAYTLGQVWQKCDKATRSCPPSVRNSEAQFREGALIIKSAGVTATPAEWPILEGAAKWQIYRKPFTLGGGTTKSAKPRLTDIRVGIFDIIVKDSIASPETGWVFTTLVYDKDAVGKDAWDRMVPLGAMWGNDPSVNSAKNPGAVLQETYISPDAPEYSTVTLGYGGRMSGPFDIAVKYGVMVEGKKVKSLRSSACLSCHGTTSFKTANYNLLTFFYPTIDHKRGKPWDMYTPGSEMWNVWFQNKPGNVPQSPDEGVIALDYSTFLEAVLMNYNAAINSKAFGDQYFEEYRRSRNAFRHGVH